MATRLAFTVPVQLISQLVGGAVLAGSLAYKLPQAVRIVRARSSAGVSASAYLIESAGLACSAIYSARSRFPFLACGELYSTLFQNLIILALVAIFPDKDRPKTTPQRLPKLSIVSAVAYVAFVASVLARGVQSLVTLQLAAIPMQNISRIPQMLLIEKRKDTGQLAPVTLGLSVAGNLARVFTTLTQVRDSAFLAGVLVALFFNSALCLQWWRYRPGRNKTYRSA